MSGGHESGSFGSPLRALRAPRAPGQGRDGRGVPGGLARPARRGKPCVVKLLLPEVAGDAESVERFIEEARVLVSLAHRNVVQILEFGKAKGEYFIAMEYIEGVSLGGL